MRKIGFIGSGNMAFALIKAIKGSGLASGIISSDIDKDRLSYVKKKLDINTTLDNMEVVRQSDIIFLAVKPQNINDVIDKLKDHVQDKIIISIAAGITLDTLNRLNTKVVRVMPNTPCLIGEMAAGFAVNSLLDDDDLITVEELLNSAGKSFLLKEKDLDAVTGLSGSGPAFMAYIIQAFISAGVKQGLSKDIASELASRTALGTSRLLIEKGLTTKELIDMVTSPNGTTAAGREVLENSGIKEIIERTIEAATKRSIELGK